MILWHDVAIDRAVLDKLDRCRIIVRCGAGYDNVDVAAAGERGIPVSNVPDYGTNDVADHTLALLLSLWRGLPRVTETARADTAGWAWVAANELRRLAGATLGIIGMGRIGTAVALRAQAFQMRVICYDPYLADGYDKALGVDRRRSLNSLLADADAITFHAPLTDETRGMAGLEFFARARAGVVVVNTARGGIIQLGALADALRSGQVGAAGLDVLESEPPDEDHPLIDAWRRNEPWVAGRLLVTPHVAFMCAEAYEEMRRKAAQTVRDYLSEGTLRNAVNTQWLVR